MSLNVISPSCPLSPSLQGGTQCASPAQLTWLKCQWAVGEYYIDATLEEWINNSYLLIIKCRICPMCLFLDVFKKDVLFLFLQMFLKKHHILILYNQSIYSNLPTGPTSPGPHPPRLTSAEAQAIRQRLRVRLGAAVTSQRWRGWHHNGGQWLHTIRGWVFTCHDAWWFLNVVVFFGGSPWFVCLMSVCLFVFVEGFCGVLLLFLVGHCWRYFWGECWVCWLVVYDVFCIVLLIILFGCVFVLMLVHVD